MGCDDVINQINEIRRMFQSTHPHGVRQKHLLGSEISNSFNPRTRMGCDESEPDVFFQPTLRHKQLRLKRVRRI